MIQVHVALTAVEVRVLSRAPTKKRPWMALKADSEAFFYFGCVGHQSDFR
jgi:hypothetical protein